MERRKMEKERLRAIMSKRGDDAAFLPSNFSGCHYLSRRYDLRSALSGFTELFKLEDGVNLRLRLGLFGCKGSCLWNDTPGRCTIQPQHQQGAGPVKLAEGKGLSGFHNELRI